MLAPLRDRYPYHSVVRVVLARHGCDTQLARSRLVASCVKRPAGEWINPTSLLHAKQVIVKFAGCMDTRGFSKGRVSAALLRTPAEAGSSQNPTRESVGYAPHARQKLNLGDQFHQTPGTIFIQHRPRCIPLTCGVFEVAVTALSLTEYTVVVVAGQCELCTSLVSTRLQEARQLKVRFFVICWLQWVVCDIVIPESTHMRSNHTVIYSCWC